MGTLFYVYVIVMSICIVIGISSCLNILDIINDPRYKEMKELNEYHIHGHSYKAIKKGHFYFTLIDRETHKKIKMSKNYIRKNYY